MVPACPGRDGLQRKSSSTPDGRCHRLHQCRRFNDVIQSQFTFCGDVTFVATVLFGDNGFLSPLPCSNTGCHGMPLPGFPISTSTIADIMLGL
jgi:hypothetical protein